MTKILVVEDEPAILESVAYALGKAGHETKLAASLAQARMELDDTVQLIVLDLMLPDGSGFDWIRELASLERQSLAIIVLSSRDSEVDRVQALEMGADDYVTKPFSPREVVARVAAVLRRTEGRGEATTRSVASHLSTDLESRRAFVDGVEVDLTRVEFDLLHLLLSGEGRVFSRPKIIDQVWGPGFALSDRTIDSHVKALRKKIVDAGGHSEWIETVRGIGYRCQPEALES